MRKLGGYLEVSLEDLVFKWGRYRGKTIVEVGELDILYLDSIVDEIRDPRFKDGVLSYLRRNQKSLLRKMGEVDE